MRKKYLLAIASLLSFVGLISAQTRTVTGTVTSSEDKEPIIGASVLIKGFSMGAQTDLDGSFTIERVPEGAKTLVISFMGMTTKEVAIKPNLRVVLDPDTKVLDEVVVTGIVPMDKRLFTGAADKLTASDVKLDGIADISRALEGRSAGVSVQNVSGTFGTAPKITVRGVTSIYGSSKPLWVVDGVILEDVVEINSNDLSSGDATTLISSAIAGLNAEDIESFQILKDGSATSIYGARAMSGVIVITTKRGRAGVSTLNYTGEFTTRLKPSYRNFNIMNSQEQMDVYQQLKSEGGLNLADIFRARDSGVFGEMYHLTDKYDPVTGEFALANDPAAFSAFLHPSEYRNTDWFDLLFSNALMMNHSVSLSTGTEKASNYASLSVMHDPGWMKKSNVSRYTLNLNSTYNISKDLSIVLGGNSSYRKQIAPGTISQDQNAVSGDVSRGFDINPFNYSLSTSRTLDPEKRYTRYYAPFNIFDELERNYIDVNVLDLRFQGELKWKVFKGMEMSLLGALKYNTSSQEHKIHESSNYAAAYRAMENPVIQEKNPWLYTDPNDPNSLAISVLPRGGFYDTRENRMYGYDLRFSTKYNTVIKNDHILNLFAGAEANAQDRMYDAFDGWGMQYDGGEKAFFDYRAFKQMKERNNDYYILENTRKRNLAFFSMLTYSYKGRYTLAGTGRLEGTNRLGRSKKARWLPTWNISGAWNAHEEAFFENMKSYLSHLTVKGSYSLTADAGPAFVTNSHVHISNFTPWKPFSNVSEPALRIISLENSELTYEKKHELNIGLDFGFPGNRVNMIIDFYRRNNFDLIGRMNTQRVGGEGLPWANVANMKSSGAELSISTLNVKRKNFQWTSDFIFSYTKNKITKLHSKPRVFALLLGSGYREGYAHGSIFSIPFEGLDNEGLPTYLINDKTVGRDNYSEIDFQEIERVDYLKHEGVITPPITGSIGNLFTYRGFKLNVFITYSAGNKVRLDPVFNNEYTDFDAIPREFKNRWALPGEENKTNIPKIISMRDDKNYTNLDLAYSAYNYSSARIASGSFVRLKELSLSYEIPKSYFAGSIINNLSLKLQGTNLLLLYADKKLNGQDPEFFRSGGVSAPVPKQITFTTKVGF